MMYFGVAHWNVGMTMQEAKEKIAFAARACFRGDIGRTAESLGIQVSELSILLNDCEKRESAARDAYDKRMAENTRRLYEHRYGREGGASSNAPEILRTEKEKRRMRREES